MYINKVILCGNLTKAPEMKTLTSGQTVTSFSIATNEVYKDNNGQKQERVEYHNIQVWGKQAETCAKYLVKGSQVLLEGKMTTRSWEDKTSQEKKYRTEVIAERVQFGRKPQGAENSNTQPQSQEAKPDVKPGGYDGPIHINGQEVDYPDATINVDDIPF